MRAFARAQRIRVERFPDAVAPATPSDRDYWRFLVRRAPLEGLCVHYQTYDASGDENDWNLNIYPDPAYRWMLDPQILWALSLSSGAPSPIDLGELKYYSGTPVIECELTPDNDLYDTFVSAGLPITSGGWWPDGAEQEGKGPTNQRVGVYGVFAGDYGHGGRPEIHPFDTFWRRFHDPRASTMTWDLGVFQDDSNRFNGDWSRAPIDVELRVPFCVDFPVSVRTAVTNRATFTLRRSPLCSVVGKNTRAGPGAGDVSETFTARTVRLNPRARNRLEVTVEDRTGVPGNAFSLRLDDLTFTSTGTIAQLGRRAWLAGAIVIRVAIDQDGFAYWRLSGPNSATAADAPDDVGAPQLPEEQENAPALANGGRSPLEVIRVLEARPVVPLDEGEPLAAELVVEKRSPGGDPVRHSLTVRPRESPVVVIDGAPVELESFDLFATIRVDDGGQGGKRIQRDITDAIARLAGLERLSHALPRIPATIEVDDHVTVDVLARYAPYRDGSVQGEERSCVGAP